ncbi:MAG: ATP-dependent RecD-like DNA helicase [Desulfovibrionaceae bacterium]|nr:ATP-dependent RecD-like DNA helicase [Desulfovibrionaceae bacterium]
MVPTDSSERSRPGSLVPQTEAKPGEVSFSGSVDRVIFENTENGFAILRVTPDSKEAGRGGIPLQGVTCVGTLLNPKGSMRLRFTGRFVNNARYGRQFAFDSAVEQVPASEAGLIGYLSSGLIKGMGAEMAQRVVQAFGADTMRILDEEPERLLSVRGIGTKVLAGIRESWNKHRGISSLMQFLQPHGISSAYGVRIYNEYGVRALEMVRENPYRLAMDIRGIGFATADAIAEKLGVPRDSPLRVQGAVLYVLQKASDNGDVFLPRSVLLDRIETELHLDPGLVPPALEALELDKRIVVDGEELTPEENGGRRGDCAVYLAAHHHCEARTAYYLERLQMMPRNVSFKDADAQVRMVLEQHQPRLAAAQVEAVRMAARSKVMVLTGGPGTGKTTIIKAIISLYAQVTSRISLAAPTGRAAKRMAEATGMEASTLHRMLEFNPVDNTFERNEDQPLACDLLIVDEASMMDALLFYYLMKAVPSGCTVILVGDIYQLPSVGPGAVLADIINSGKVPVTRLNEIFRQASTSAIVSNAHTINSGRVPTLVRPWEEETDFYFRPCTDAELAAPDLVSLICSEIPARFKLDPFRDIQLLTPMHKGAVGTQNMNRLLQEALNPVPPAPQEGGPAQGRKEFVQLRRGDAVYRVGDKVMQIKNNYSKDVFNGDLGVISDIDREMKLVAVDFEGVGTRQYEMSEMDELVLAYAISIHKSQGSEYPAVVVPLFMQHFVMLQRNLLYTAITRGKKLVVVVGDPSALARAVGNASVRRRFTRLAWRLSSYIPAPGA